MRLNRLIFRSLLHFLPHHLLVAAGVAMSTAILTGALLTGNSIRYSLEQITASRLGNTTHLVSAPDRYFRSELAEEISTGTHTPAAPLLMLDGMAVTGGGEYRINHLTVTGVDHRFREVYPDFPIPGGDEVVISENVAAQLGVKPGDPILVRIAKASLIPQNAPFVSEEENTISLRATVSAILSGEGAGRFNLRNSQSAPRNLFISLDRLNSLMSFEGKANRILITGNPEIRVADSLLRRALTPEDAGLRLRELKRNGEWEITSERIFLDEKSARVWMDIPGSRAIITWFVNSAVAGDRLLPYSFASSLPGGGLEQDEIILNSWAAGDLRVKEGDQVVLSWFEVGALRQLTEKSRPFRVSSVVPLTGEWADSTLMPPLPGMADAGHCREWEAGIPIDLNKIRPEDEEYWNIYRGTPKIFVAPETAEEIWANRFGNYTSIRIPEENFSPPQFLHIFREKLTPADFGFSLTAAREAGVTAARSGVDFGQLFLGLSFFLLVAAIILTALLFRFNLEKRISHAGTLLQLGFTRKKTALLLFLEGSVVAIAGVAAGLLLAVGYVRIIFAFLNTLWWDIIRTPVIFLNISGKSLAAGALISLLTALAAIGIPLYRALLKEVSDLHRATGGELSPRFSRFRRWGAGVLTVAALVPVILQIIGKTAVQPLLFFISGGLLLTGVAFAFMGWLSESARKKRASLHRLQPSGIILRQIAGNYHRSSAIFLLFALGTFIVVATGANRQNMYRHLHEPSSGTGGFTAWNELAVPLLFDLNDSVRRETEGISTPFTAVQFSRVDGDDASCLNLNKIENPAILGVNPDQLKGRFSFVSHTADLDLQNPWASLRKNLPGGVVPGIADQTVIQWGLMMKIGDTLLYLGEKGDTLRIKLIGGLAPSLFQGSLLIADTHFFDFFPTHSGSTVFLTSWEEEERGSAEAEIKDLLRDNGIEMTPADRRLAEFASVTNTYLAIFLALGILGLILGTVGLAVVLARSVLERRGELAAMIALGFSRARVTLLITGEYLFLLTAGTIAGFAAALIAVWPSLTGSHSQVSAGNISLMILLILGNGLVWTFTLAHTAASPSRLLPALRDL